MSRMNAIDKYRFARWCFLHHLKPLAYATRAIIYLVHNSYIPFTAEIGEGTIFGYKGIGCVVHGNAKIGKNCTIGTGVTIGGGGGRHVKTFPENDNIRRDVPVIGDDVYISTGAKIIGPIVIGDNVVIGANAVVIGDVPSNVTVGGVPAKVLHNALKEE